VYSNHRQFSLFLDIKNTQQILFAVGLSTEQLKNIFEKILSQESMR
jgi:hypothetical protein